MYTGTADHALTAELVELVDVPVIASGDIDDAREGAGGARDDRLRRGHGRAAPRRAIPGRSRRSWATATASPTREEVVAELLLFMHETVEEIGEQPRDADS